MANFCILQKHLALNAQNIIVAVSDCDSFGIPPTPPKITIEATPATSMHVFQFSLEEIQEQTGPYSVINKLSRAQVTT